MIEKPPGKTVLVADDEQSVREICKEALELSGYRVLLARDGVEALDVFRAHSKTVSCVLLDLKMPRKNGEETFRELRELRAELPVILISAYADPETLYRLEKVGLSAFVPKPYNLHSLMSTLDQLLNSQAS